MTNTLFFTPAPLTIDDCDMSPLRRGAWHGGLETTDGTDTSDFTRDDVAQVLAYGSTAEADWDGKAAGIWRLHDGRYVSWETWWGPTGNGFYEDAYGGDTDIVFSSSLETARRSISESARELLIWNTEA